jgi:hypothetical protein
LTRKWIAHANTEYEPRYCAFIDILGFTQLVKEVGGQKLSFNFIRELLERLHNPPKLEVGLLTYALTDFRAQSISDAVAISTKAEVTGFMQIADSISQLTLDLLSQGYFMRGAIVKGNLYHDNRVVFGDALVSAGHMERTVAVYPRIVVSRQVAAEAMQNDLLGKFAVLRLRQANDGPYYIHTLSAFQKFLEHIKTLDFGQDVDAESLQYWSAIQMKIIERFQEAVDEPRHFEKIQWFARYWNEIADEYQSRYSMRIDRAGLLVPKSYWGG